MLTKEQQKNLLTTALEGGSNYWYNLPDLTEARKHKQDGDCTIDYIFRAVQEGLKIEVNDLEDEDEVLGYISKQGLKEGAILMQHKYPKHYADAITENDDAITGDVFFQLVVMQEIVFG